MTQLLAGHSATTADAAEASGDTTPSRWDRWRNRWRDIQPRKLSLRTRILLMFGIGALFLSVFLATAAYSFTRSSVVNQRDKAGIEQAYRNAQVAQNELSANNPSAKPAIDRLNALGVSRFAINYRTALGRLWVARARLVPSPSRGGNRKRHFVWSFAGGSCITYRAGGYLPGNHQSTSVQP